MKKKPRIFISYRRNDSLTMTGRIYDRLCTAFGQDFVFKDMEDIPIGADFKAVIEQEVNTSDVLLAIIGPTWASLTDTEGVRRLDDANDFVRIEIVSALKRPTLLVIPILVDGASMPTLEQLSSDIQPLHYRNAAVVRNDPDFNRDIEQLFGQIKKHFGLGDKPPRNLPLVGIAVGMTMVVALVAAFLLVQMQFSVSNKEDVISTVQPVSEGEFMVLVAQPEPLRNPAPRDVARYITEDLRRSLETNVPFSQIRVREYKGVISSDGQAKQIADANGAAVIVWGSYTDSDITLNLQVGSLAVFPNMRFDRSLLERTINFRLRLNDELSQSIAFPVVGMLAVLQVAADEFLDFTLSTGMSNLVKIDDVQILDDDLSSNLFRSLQASVQSHALALEPMTQALQDDPSNSLIYGIRAGLSFQEGNYSAAMIDLQTAESLGPQGWQFPTYVRSGIYFRQPTGGDATQELSKAVAAFPNEWYPIYMRGTYNFLSGNYALAQSDVNQSIALRPTTNWPYFIAIGLALRDGRLADAATLFATVRRDFPDVSLGTRMIQVVFGDAIDTEFYQLFNLTNKLLFSRRYDEVIQDSEAAVAAGTHRPEIYLSRGTAFYCLGNWQAAETNFTTGLTLDPDYVTMYLLRAATRMELGDLPGALADVSEVRKLSQDPLIERYIEAGIHGETLACDEFLSEAVSDS